jgi:NAD(P)-dependent dehydrogenase (short-subunit alcohol dehydrogenase family)
MQTKSFNGKVALVTGGSRGIGAGIVRRAAVSRCGFFKWSFCSRSFQKSGMAHNIKTTCLSQAVWWFIFKRTAQI